MRVSHRKNNPMKRAAADFGTIKNAFKNKMAECSPSLLYGESHIDNIPCTLAVFMANNLPNEFPDLSKSGWLIEADEPKGTRCARPSFPQHETDRSTFDSSRRVYYAYRDLGAYAVRRFAIEVGTKEIILRNPESNTAILNYSESKCEDVLFPKVE